MRLNPIDNVVIARRDIPAGTDIIQEKITAAARVPRGHKIASAAIAAGDAIRRNGRVIGRA